jgi:hypothetical protein
MNLLVLWISCSVSFLIGWIMSALIGNNKSRDYE